VAVEIDWPTSLITVNQADLTFVTGTLYELDTDQFRKDLNALQASEIGMPWPTTHVHNTQVSVAGITLPRVIEIIAPYSIQFLPDSQWSVRLAGSNNNIFDIESGILVQNQVQVIPGNSAGLVIGQATLTAAQSANLALIQTLANGITFQKNTALSNFPFVMTGTDGQAKTGLTITGQRRQDAGVFGSLDNSVTEVGQGAYTVDLSAADLNADTVLLLFTAGDALPTAITITTVTVA